MPAGTKDDPWQLATPPGSSAYTMRGDEDADPPALVCQVGPTTLKYQLRAINDLHAWLKSGGDWVPLGAADENKPAADGTAESWGRSPVNPVGGWYGLRKGHRGRFGMYPPPLLEALGLAEITRDARNNKMSVQPCPRSYPPITGFSGPSIIAAKPESAKVELFRTFTTVLWSLSIFQKGPLYCCAGRQYA